MFDKEGRVWLAATVRGMENPAFCKKGSDHPSAKVVPDRESPRQAAMLDPKTMKYSFIDTCFGTHHPQFGYDADNTLWFSGTGPVAGWVNTKIFGTRPAMPQRRRAGRRSCSTPMATASVDEYVEPDKPVDPGKDKRIAAAPAPTP